MKPTIEDIDSDNPPLDSRRHSWGELWRWIWPILRPHKVRLIGGATMIAISGGAWALMPLLPMFVIDNAIPQRDLRLAIWVAVALVVAQTLRMTLWYVSMRQILMTQERVTFAMRCQGFMHLQRLCLRFHSKYSSGYLYQKIFGTSITAAAGFMQTVIKQVSIYVTAFFISVLSCLYLNVTMTGVVLLGSVAYIVLAKAVSKRIYLRTKSAHDAQNRMTDFIMDRLRAAKTVKAMTLEEKVQREFEDRLWPTQIKSHMAVKETFRLNILSEGIGYVLTALIISVGAYFAIREPTLPGQKALTAGELVAFMGYQATFIAIVSTLTNVFGDFMAARAGMDQLMSVLETQSTVPDKSAAPMLPDVRGELRMRDLSFSYAGSAKILDCINLVIPPGQSVALVGKSGSGKTTLTNLLMRFYDPDEGQILLDGTDVRELPLRGYRSLFGVVLQDPYLFDESIETNLRHAAPNATEEEIIQALKQAQAWDFVQQLGGLKYRVGEAGGGLSGGQRQRLAIARCLLTRSRFVILDEPTSALDPESELVVQKAINELCRGRTVLVIAHRLSTIRNADRVLVLDRGRVAQDGTFDELAHQPGLFNQMHSAFFGSSSLEKSA